MVAAVIMPFRGHMLAFPLIIAAVILGINGLCHDGCCPDETGA
jgi:hypothetical protein